MKRRVGKVRLCCRQFLSLVVVLILAATACGGSEEGDGGETTVAQAGTTLPGSVTTPPVATTQSDDGREPASAEGSELTELGVNTAVITIGDHTYEFEWVPDGLQQCDPDFFGAFVAVSPAPGDQPSFDSEFPPQDDPELIAPRIEVSDPENDIHWTADPEENIGTTFEIWPARVDSHQINGNTVSGTATFVGSPTPIGESPEGVQGGFEITCVPESSD